MLVMSWLGSSTSGHLRMFLSKLFKRKPRIIDCPEYKDCPHCGGSSSKCFNFRVDIFGNGIARLKEDTWHKCPMVRDKLQGLADWNPITEKRRQAIYLPDTSRSVESYKQDE